MSKRPRATGAKTIGGPTANSHPATYRLFFAFSVPSGVRRYAVQVQDALRRCGVRGRWVRPESMHLTLLFLGERPAAEMPELSRVVRDFARHVAGFRLSADRVTCFAWPPRLLFLGFSEAPAGDRFEQTARALRRALERAGLPVPPASKVQRAVPHLTLVRFRGSRERRTLGPWVRFEDRGLAWRTPLPDPAGTPPVHCDRITLFRSLLGPGGAQYQPIDTFEMTPCADA